MPAKTKNLNATNRNAHKATAKVVDLAGSKSAKTLYEAFDAFNWFFFESRLAPGLVLITQAQSSRTLGDYIKRDIHGLESRIRIAPVCLKKGELFALDVLLHEMIHAWQEEIEGNGENGYRGHGPRFAAKCNAIGRVLGLRPVGVKGRDGLPDCAHWPMNVRPAGYYAADYEAPTRRPSAPKQPSAPAPERDPAADAARELQRRLEAFVSVLGQVPTDALEIIGQLIAGELAARSMAEAAE